MSCVCIDVSLLLPTPLDLWVSLAGQVSAEGQFPSGMHPNTHIRFYVPMSELSLLSFSPLTLAPYWDNILKSNSNGTYFGLLVENMNCIKYGFVYFGEACWVDGVAVANIIVHLYRWPKIETVTTKDQT
ncbi:hypothetical protein EDC04DRAFT_2569313 [Pisolithus marmoratus]|nr:hypothetical protein EDC04DRAFT_2569313 [Pisolithus marmoratus]